MSERGLFDDLPDLATAEACRDSGMAQVAENTGDWFDAACVQVARLRDWSGTGEDLRLRLLEVVGPPHSANAWGALIAHAIRSGWLRRTGERRPMQTVRSHARRTDVYESAD